MSWDKRGGEKLLSIWWFFVLTVVGVGIVVAVLIFYSADEDIRSFEAEILNERILNCISEQGILIEEILNDDFDLLKKCSFNNRVFGEDGLFYANIKISDEQGDNLREKEGDIAVGNSQFLKECEFQEGGVKAKHYAKCFERERIILYEKDNLKIGKIKILTASNNWGRKIAIIENA